MTTAEARAGAAGPAPRAARRPWAARLVARGVVTLGLLALALYLVDLRRLREQLVGLSPGWVALGVLLVAPQMVLGALRWRDAASRLGVALPLRRAVAEYYLTTLFNNVLPGGVAGDALRAFRHGRLLGRQGSGALGTALEAVVLERLSGQVATALVVAVGLLLPWAHPLRAQGRSLLGLLAAALAAVALLAPALRWTGLSRTRAGAALGRTLSDAREVLARPRAFLAQMSYSLLLLATFLGGFYFAGRAVGVTLDVVFLTTALPLVLLATAIPLSIAGWGVREVAAAGLWASFGRQPEQAVAISVVYGAAGLLGALPGALVLLARRG